jgi:hypothetical protein
MSSKLLIILWMWKYKKIMKQAEAFHGVIVLSLADSI